MDGDGISDGIRIPSKTRYQIVFWGRVNSSIRVRTCKFKPEPNERGTCWKCSIFQQVYQPISNKNQIWLMCSSPNLSVNEDHHPRDVLEVRLATPLLAAQYFIQTYRRFDALHEAYDYMTCNVIHHGFSWRFPSHTDLNQNSRLTFVQTSFDVGSEIITAHSTWWPVLDGPRGNTTLVWLVSIPSRNARSNQFQHKKTRLHPRHIPYPIFLEMMCPWFLPWLAS